MSTAWHLAGFAWFVVSLAAIIYAMHQASANAPSVEQGQDAEYGCSFDESSSLCSSKPPAPSHPASGAARA